MITTLDCGHELVKDHSSSAGYGTNGDGIKLCYNCCAEQDKAFMREHGKNTLYLTKDEKGWKVTNWPGTLVFRPHYVKKGWHNIAGSRHDAWFTFEGHVWHAVQYGEWSDIARCKRTKQAA